MPASELFSLAGLGLPLHEALLDDLNETIHDERTTGQHKDPGEHRIDVQGAFGLQDEIADPRCGSQILPDLGVL